MSPLAPLIALLIVGTVVLVRLAATLYRAYTDGRIVARRDHHERQR